MNSDNINSTMNANSSTGQLLYDFDCERDPLTLIQALAIMSHWHRGSTCHKDSIYWLEAGISLAYKYGLHQEGLVSSEILHNRGLIKRIWWSLNSHSKLLSLGAAHPLRTIKDQDFDMSPLTMQDFDLTSFSAAVLELMCDCSILHHVNEQKTQAEMFLVKILFCNRLNSAGMTVGLNLRPPIYLPCSHIKSSKSANKELLHQYSQRWNQSAKQEMNGRSGTFWDITPHERALRLYKAHLKLIDQATRAQVSGGFCFICAAIGKEGSE